jgi:hypothetical protein
MRRTLLILTSLLVFSGCGGGGEEAGKAFSKRDEGALTIYELSEPKFSLGVPKSWTAITREQLHDTGALERFAKENPTIAPTLQGVLEPGSPIKFLALDSEVKQKFVTNVNVVVQDVPDGMDLPDLERSSIAELSALRVVHGLKTRVTSLPAGQALKLTYLMQLRYGAATRSVATLQYALIEDGKSYIVTYSTLAGLERRYASSFADSAHSLRLDD